jgi:hypothetical protein
VSTATLAARRTVRTDTLTGRGVTLTIDAETEPVGSAERVARFMLHSTSGFAAVLPACTCGRQHCGDLEHYRADRWWGSHYSSRCHRWQWELVRAYAAAVLASYRPWRPGRRQVGVRSGTFEPRAFEPIGGAR